MPDLPADPVDWDLAERDAWLAEHDDDTPAPVEVVVAEDD